MITIITATFNAAEVLPALIASVRAQSDRSFEWIIVDGGSTDGTVALLEASGDVITRWISEQDFGIYDALNKGLMMSSRAYYLVMGADDRLEPRAIEVYSQAIESAGADIVTAAVRIGQGVRSPPDPGPSLRSGPPLVSAHSVGAVIRRGLHDEIGMYSRRFPIAADTYFLLQAQQRGKSVTRLPDIVGTFGTQGASGTDVLGALCESFRANAEVRGRVLLHAGLLLLRIARHRGRINRELRRRSRG